MHHNTNIYSKCIETFINSKLFAAWPWSPTSMKFTQRWRFICLRPFMSWPMMLSISLSGLSNWITHKRKRLSVSTPGTSEWATFSKVAEDVGMLFRDGVGLTSLLRGPRRWPNVSGCSECTAKTYGLQLTSKFVWMYVWLGAHAYVCVCEYWPVGDALALLENAVVLADGVVERESVCVCVCVCVFYVC